MDKLLEQLNIKNQELLDIKESKGINTFADPMSYDIKGRTLYVTTKLNGYPAQHKEFTFTKDTFETKMNEMIVGLGHAIEYYKNR